MDGPSKPPAKENFKRYATAIHPEVLKALQKAAIDADQRDYERLHDILCYELGLEHLTLQSPDPIHSA